MQVQNFHISYTGISKNCMDGWCHKGCLWMISNSEDTRIESDEGSDKGYILNAGVMYPKKFEDWKVQKTCA